MGASWARTGGRLFDIGARTSGTLLGMGSSAQLSHIEEHTIRLYTAKENHREEFSVCTVLDSRALRLRGRTILRRGSGTFLYAA